MANTRKWENYPWLLIGIIAIGVGALLFFTGDTTMRMVEAGQVTSQAGAESEYNQAADIYLYGGIAMVSGFGLMLASGFMYLAEVHREMSAE